MNGAPSAQRNLSIIKWLTFFIFMFMMFAMTTDSVGVIIPEVIKAFHLSMTAGGAFHYAAMSGIAFAGFFLGYLADKIGRKKSIIVRTCVVRVELTSLFSGSIVCVLCSSPCDFRRGNRHF
jgi:fucose permease